MAKRLDEETRCIELQKKSGNFTKITEVAVTFQCTSVPITSYNNSGVSFKPPCLMHIQ